MSPDLYYILILAFRMAVAAAFVVSASFITEHSGPVIGALVATLPISAGPSYVFLALDHDASFIAEGALASLPINAATIVLSLTYVLLAQRRGMLASCAAAVVVWLALALIIHAVYWSLLAGVAVNVVTFAVCVPILRRFRHVKKMPLITRRWYDIPLRASLVALSARPGTTGPLTPSAVSLSAHRVPPAPRAATFRRDAAPSRLRRAAPPRLAALSLPPRATAPRTAADRRPARVRSGRGPELPVSQARPSRARSPAAADRRAWRPGCHRSDPPSPAAPRVGTRLLPATP